MRFRRLYVAVLIELAILIVLFTLFTRAASGTPASHRLERPRPAAGHTARRDGAHPAAETAALRGAP